MDAEIVVAVNFRGQTHNMTVSTSATVAEFQKELADFFGVTPDFQKLSGLAAPANEIQQLPLSAVLEEPKVTLSGHTIEELSERPELLDRSQDFTSSPLQEEEYLTPEPPAMPPPSAPPSRVSPPPPQATSTSTQSWSDFFEEQFGPLHPNFYTGDFDNAFARARIEKKFLLVVVHSEQEPESVKFCRDVLTSEAVIELLNAHFIVWGGEYTRYHQMASLQSMLARNDHIREQMIPKSYPYVSIVVAISGGFSVLEVMQGPIPIDLFIGHLLTAIEGHGSVLEEERERLPQQGSMSAHDLVRMEQDLAYEEALAQDRKKDEEARQKQEAEELERALALAAEEEAERQKRRDEERRQHKKGALRVEPLKGTPGTTYVVIRLPDGSRMERNFPSESPLSVVFDLLDIQGFDIEKYTLVTNFPARKFTLQDAQTVTLQSGDFGRQALFHLGEK